MKILARPKYTDGGPTVAGTNPAVVAVFARALPFLTTGAADLRFRGLRLPRAFHTILCGFSLYALNSHGPRSADA